MEQNRDSKTDEKTFHKDQSPPYVLKTKLPKVMSKQHIWVM